MFLVERRPGADWVAGVDTREQPLWDEHAAFMDDLFERGLVRLAGPIVDAGGDPGTTNESTSVADFVSPRGAVSTPRSARQVETSRVVSSEVPPQPAVANAASASAAATRITRRKGATREPQALRRARGRAS